MSNTRSMLAGIASTTLAAVPVFMLGSLAVLMRGDLGFDEQGLGIAVSTFFATAALSSVPGGNLAERVEPRHLTLATAIVTTACMLSMATIVRTWAQMLVVLAVAGVSMGVTQPAVNLSLARTVGHGRQGFAFGVKQSAIPLATLLAGASLPLVGTTVGWRWAYLSVVVLFGLVLALPVRGGAVSPALSGSSSHYGVGGAPRRGLVLIALGAAGGAGAANCLGAFLVASLVADGIPPARAGTVFALGSLCGVVVRVVTGWSADRRGRRHLLMVSWLMLAGAGGYAALGLGSGDLLLIGASMLSFGGGWGWAGLLTFAVVRLHAQTPAAASGVLQVGVFVGGVTWPLVFGAVVVRSSYDLAWGLVAVLSIMAALLIRVARRLIRAHTGEHRPGNPEDDPAD